MSQLGGADGGGPVTVSETVPVAFASAASVTVTGNVEVPVAVGRAEQPRRPQRGAGPSRVARRLGVPRLPGDRLGGQGVPGRFEPVGEGGAHRGGRGEDTSAVGQAVTV